MASVYGISYADFLELRADVLFNMLSVYPQACAVKAGDFTVAEALKQWQKILYPYVTVGNNTPEPLLKRLKELKEKTGRKEIPLREIIGG